MCRGLFFFGIQQNPVVVAGAFYGPLRGKRVRQVENHALTGISAEIFQREGHDLVGIACRNQFFAEFIKIFRPLFPLFGKPRLFLDPGRHRTGDNRHGKHTDKGDRIAGNGKVKCVVRIGKVVVCADHTGDCRKDSPQIARGES